MAEPVPAAAAFEPIDVEPARAALARARADIERALHRLNDAGDALAAPPDPSAGEKARGRRRLSGGGGGDRRVPVPIPPGRFAEEDATAEHLVRVASLVLIVDGYNATLQRWPSVPLAEQRRRLVDALCGLAARAGVGVEVIFDGSGDAGVRTRAQPRQGVSVTFTPEDMEADEAIVDRVRALPVSVPVAVATDDRAVQAAVERLGANVVGQRQLFALLG